MKPGTGYRAENSLDLPERLFPPSPPGARYQISWFASLVELPSQPISAIWPKSTSPTFPKIVDKEASDARELFARAVVTPPGSVSFLHGLCEITFPGAYTSKIRDDGTEIGGAWQRGHPAHTGVGRLSAPSPRLIAQSIHTFGPSRADAIHLASRPTPRPPFAHSKEMLRGKGMPALLRVPHRASPRLLGLIFCTVQTPVPYHGDEDALDSCAERPARCRVLDIEGSGSPLISPSGVDASW
ncbi:hypothetical protein B0H12DRAFT_1236079 [Mycena haematopus]|nr:hypothetical protein B0H12DRAFT_1236079 [Mycena haematopus]